MKNDASRGNKIVKKVVAKTSPRFDRKKSRGPVVYIASPSRGGASCHSRKAVKNFRPSPDTTPNTNIHCIKLALTFGAFPSGNAVLPGSIKPRLKYIEISEVRNRAFNQSRSEFQRLPEVGLSGLFRTPYSIRVLKIAVRAGVSLDALHR